MDNFSIVSLVSIATVGGVLYLALIVAGRKLKKQYLRDANNLNARKAYTKIAMLKNIAYVVLFVLTGGAMLMVFEPFRKLGAGLLASAGVLTVISGFAAQKTIAAIIAGIQVAFSQPIRIDDIVIVENEWGKVEDIHLTYVVIRTWDLRRLVVPMSYFIDKPFQNWSRESSSLIGTIYMHTDYNIPVAKIRTEFDRIVTMSPLWDGKTKVLQVTDLAEGTIELRGLMSAADADKVWDIRCAVREELINFLQREYPDCLPKTRIEIGNGGPTSLPRGGRRKTAAI